MEYFKKMIFCAFFSIIIFQTINGASFASAQMPEVLYAVRAVSPPVIDGKLEDEVWETEPLIDGGFLVFWPTHGEEFPQETKVWISYDPDNLYFAFYAYDSEPNGIITSLAKRDDIWRDDWICVSLNTNGSASQIYSFYVNPSGIQCDQNIAPGSWDSSADWIWYSSGRVTKDGYIVEMQIPLKSIRYASGKDVKMGVNFRRRLCRQDLYGSYPDWHPSKTIFEATIPVVFGQLDNQLKLEALPSVTYGKVSDLTAPGKWDKNDTSSGADIGIGLTYGITSSITAAVTINPDFSQVESDAFQVVANQRYPIFYAEKRPFFMEAGGIYRLAGVDFETNLQTAVHTRTIIDPALGVLVSGEEGKLSFGAMTANDKSAGMSWEDDEEAEGENPHLGDSALFIMGRGSYSLGLQSFIGLIYSSREFGDQYNRVIGADFRCRLSEKSLFSTNILQSFSRKEGDDNILQDPIAGLAYSLIYNYFDDPLEMGLYLEHYGSDFQMDTAFYQRTAFTRLKAYVYPKIAPDSETFSWIKRITPYFWGFYLHDTDTKMNDYYISLGSNFSLSSGDWFRFGYDIGRECWEGVAYDFQSAAMLYYTRLSSTIILWGSLRIGEWIYYDEENPMLGNGISTAFNVNFRPDDSLMEEVGITYQYLDNPDNGNRLYDVLILSSKTSYQFNENLFVRALIQYDSYQGVILADLLASFTLIPGTVVHVGYGSLYEKQEWRGNEWLTDTQEGRMYQTRRSLFFKASYLIRF